MSAEILLERYVESLLAGHRDDCRSIIHEARERQWPTVRLYHDLLWPAMERVDELDRTDRISLAAHHMATRINRVIADQLQAHLERREPNGKRILITCADGEPEELGAQMCADLLEGDGWEVYFVGGAVPNDEILSLVGDLRPDILMIFGTQPRGVPGVRKLIDMIREVGANPTMNIMISGGVFNRADGLWQEIRIDLFARDIKEALEIAREVQPRVPEPRVPGAPKKRRRRRKPPLLAQLEAAGQASRRQARPMSYSPSP